MIAIFKKSSVKPEGMNVSGWHPDFKNVDGLPDLKVVRTSFFINGCAALFACALGLYVGFTEMQLSAIRDEVNAAMTESDARNIANDQAIGLFEKFSQNEKHIQEVKEFLAVNKLVLSDFILDVGRSLPPGFKVTSITYKSDTVRLEGEIIGAPDEASGRAVEYVDSIRKSSFFTSFFESATLSNISRDAENGQINFDIMLKISGVGGKKVEVNNEP